MSINSFIAGLQVGPAWSHLNLMVHPLIGAANGKPSYRTLDDALTTGSFRVGEVSVSGSVPELKVLNGLSEPVLLLDGEELIGAKQNRVLNLTIMIPADTETTIPVSCVEAGRWQHRSENFTAANRAQFARGRARKLAQVSYSLRESSTRSSDQTDIWNEISAKSNRMSVQSETGAMSAIYERSQIQLDDFVLAMPKCDGQVGAVFSIGGQIAGFDAFDSADTFAKAAPKLIRSYAVDAIEIPPASGRDELTSGAVRAFLDDIGGAGTTRFKALGLGDDLRLNGLALAGAALEVSGRIIHLVSFPGTMYGDRQNGQHRQAQMARARTRRAFH
jgi:hypothetical protein